MTNRFALFAVWLAPGCLFADQVLGWRGDTSGNFSASAPPTSWSTTEHVAWKAKLPGHGNGSPIVVGSRVFVCCEPTRLVCLSAADGKQLWEADNGYDQVLSAADLQIAKDEAKQSEAIRKQMDGLRKQIEPIDKSLQEDRENGALKAERQALQLQVDSLRQELKPLERYRIPEKSAGCATATPICDGQFVYAVFGTGIVICYSLEGERQWIKLLPRPDTDWGHTASPLLAGSTLIVHLTDMTALDPKTGERRWTAKIPSSYGSPVRSQVGAVEIVITAAGDIVRVSDGAVLARKLTEPLSRSSPVVHQGLVFFVDRTARAFRLPKEATEKIELAKVWETRLPNENYFASPLYHEGLLYTVSENRMLTVLDAEGGDVVYQQRLRYKQRGPVVSSLASAGKLVFITNEEGSTKVLAAGREYKELAENPLERLRSSVAFASSRLYVRAMGALYCIEP